MLENPVVLESLGRYLEFKDSPEASSGSAPSFDFQFYEDGNTCVFDLCVNQDLEPLELYLQQSCIAHYKGLNAGTAPLKHSFLEFLRLHFPSSDGFVLDLIKDQCLKVSLKKDLLCKEKIEKLSRLGSICLAYPLIECLDFVKAKFPVIETPAQATKLPTPGKLFGSEDLAANKMPKPQKAQASSVSITPPILIPKNDKEKFVVRAFDDRVTIVTPVYLANVDDKIYYKLCIQAIVDARKSPRNSGAPLFSFTSELDDPQDDVLLGSPPTGSLELLGYLKIVLFQTHLQTVEQWKLVSDLLGIHVILRKERTFQKELLRSKMQRMYQDFSARLN